MTISATSWAASLTVVAALVGAGVASVWHPRPHFVATASASGAAHMAASTAASTAANTAAPKAVHAAAGLGLPAPGSYQLPVIQTAGNGWVLDGNPVPRPLRAYTVGAVTLLSFMYSYCSDPEGCPLAYATMQAVKERLAQDPALRGHVRLVSLSFDPSNDTPDVMRRYGQQHGGSQAVPWSFLTTASTQVLQPILDDLGQDIEIEVDDAGRPTRAISHMLKAFLIDRQGQVREIYSTAYMNPELIVNDIKSLVLERPQQ